MMKKTLPIATAFTFAFAFTSPHTNAEERLPVERQIRIEYGLTELQPLSDSAAESVRGTSGITLIQIQDLISNVLIDGPEHSLQASSNNDIFDAMLQLLNSLGPIASAQTPIGGSVNMGIDFDGRFRLIDLTNPDNNALGTLR